MKLFKTFSLAALLVLCLGISFVQAQDTVKVELGGDAVITVVIKNREAIPSLKELDINQILRDVLNQIDTTNKDAQTPIIKEEDAQTIYEYVWDEEQGVGTLMTLPDTASVSNTTSYENSTVYYQRSSRRVRVFWNLDLGLNNYFEDGNIPDSSDPYSLRPWGSRYAAFSLHQRTRIGRARSPLSIQWGTEFSFYNFMFEDDNYILEEEEGITFSDYEADFGQNLDKTKLHVSYVSIPIMINLRFRNRRGRRTYNLGFGGSVGYRIGSRSKIRFDGDGQRERDDFFLSNWRYGLEGQIGYRSFNLFFKYDLNNLFEDNRGPELNAFAFGLRF